MYYGNDEKPLIMQPENDYGDWFTSLSNENTPENFYNIKEVQAETVLDKVCSWSDEYKSVETLFFRSLGDNSQYRIVMIERIKNILLKDLYESYKKNIEKRYNNRNVEVRPVWHGTDENSVEEICRDHFNRSYQGRNGNRFGMGTYFARHVSYALNDRLSRRGSNNYKKLIMCRIVQGSSCLGEPHLKSPLINPMSFPLSRYETVVDNLENPEIYVVFNDFGALPEYVLTIAAQ
ncbi:DgyrCDS3859 [Dimorphilus gyrociliatus]|uniref:Poly [ADP-ribose] polymerase n=1 Tax=Dimorphilus gyrociliatus TaxID=2664684 RepID=A0A7I8VJS4_9ANNE|nr:DgyrCDS3859 [Dimorphilus gyrociliatus]